METRRRKAVYALAALVVLAIGVALLVRPYMGGGSLERNGQPAEHTSSDVTSGKGPDATPDEPSAQPGGRLVLRVEVDCSGILPDHPSQLFVRDARDDVTVVHDLPDPSPERIVTRIEVREGLFLLSLGSEFAISERLLRVTARGYSLGEGATVQPFEVPLILKPDRGFALRILTTDEDDRPVQGRLNVLAGGTGRSVETDGTATLNGLPGGTHADIQFTPRDANTLMGLHKVFVPPEDYLGRSFTVLLQVKRKIAATIHFYDPDSEVDPDVNQIIRVLRHDTDAAAPLPEESLLRLSEGARLRNDDFEAAGTYELAWVVGGRFGPPQRFTRGELSRLERVTLHAPAVAGHVLVQAVDSDGAPAVGVALTVRFQGPGHELRVMLTDNEGRIAIPAWDRERFAVNVSPPRGVPAQPALLMNPEDGAQFVLDLAGRQERVQLAVTPGAAGTNATFEARLEVWTQPDATVGDWQMAAWLSAQAEKVSGKMDGSAMAVPDRFIRASFERPADVTVSLVIAERRVAEWPWPDFVARSAATPARVEVAARDVWRPGATVRIAGDAGKVDWLVSHGRAPVAWFIAALYRGMEDSRWEYEFRFGLVKAGTPTPLRHAPRGGGIYTGIDATGRFALFSAAETGNDVTLTLIEAWEGTSVQIAEAPEDMEQAVVTGSFYHIEVAESRRTKYWDSAAIGVTPKDLPTTILVPRNTPLLIMPLSAGYELMYGDATISSYMHRPTAGQTLVVSLSP